MTVISQENKLYKFGGFHRIPNTFMYSISSNLNQLCSSKSICSIMIASPIAPSSSNRSHSGLYRGSDRVATIIANFLLFHQ